MKMGLCIPTRTITTSKAWARWRESRHLTLINKPPQIKNQHCSIISINHKSYSALKSSSSFEETRKYATHVTDRWSLTYLTSLQLSIALEPSLSQDMDSKYKFASYKPKESWWTLALKTLDQLHTMCPHKSTLPVYMPPFQFIRKTARHKSQEFIHWQLPPCGTTNLEVHSLQSKIVQAPGLPSRLSNCHLKRIFSL